MSARLDAAIAWRLRLETENTGSRVHEDFERWIAAHEEHAQIWRRLGDMESRLSAVDMPARAALLRRRSTLPRAAVRSGIALLLVMASLLPLANLQWPLRDLFADQVTATGELRELQLPDQSRLVMDTRSAIDIDFSGDQRRVLLRRGEILVETAHGDARPFVVQSEDGVLRPLGTRFLVRRDAEGTQLTVLAAVVAATPNGGLERRVEAGESLRLRVGAQAEAAAIGADAWTHGMLAADNARLADVVAELARYHRGYFAVDPRLADLRVTGSFPLHDTELALKAFAQTLPVAVQRRTDLWITLVPHE